MQMRPHLRLNSQIPSCFPNPISLDELNAILVEDGMKRQQFVSSVKISQVAFEKIYQRAANQE